MYSKIINLFFSGYSHILFAMNNKVSNLISFVIFFSQINFTNWSFAKYIGFNVFLLLFVLFVTRQGFFLARTHKQTLIWFWCFPRNWAFLNWNWKSLYYSRKYKYELWLKAFSFLFRTFQLLSGITNFLNTPKQWDGNR